MLAFLGVVCDGGGTLGGRVRVHGESARLSGRESERMRVYGHGELVEALAARRVQAVSAELERQRAAEVAGGVEARAATAQSRARVL